MSPFFFRFVRYLASMFFMTGFVFAGVALFNLIPFCGYWVGPVEMRASLICVGVGLAIMAAVLFLARHRRSSYVLLAFAGVACSIALAVPVPSPPIV